MPSNESDHNPDYTVCACQHCNGRIEFDASGLGESDTWMVECPHCHSETKLVGVPPLLPPAPTPEITWFGTEASAIEIRTVSGSLVEAKEIQLYEEQELREIGMEKARVSELFGGAQSPFGFIGGPFWVISNMITQNYVAQKQSQKMAQEGAALLEKLARREQLLRNTTNYFPVGRIENIDYPSPSLWRVTIPTRAFGFIHSGDDFVTVKDASGIVYSIRWSAVERYAYKANR